MFIILAKASAFRLGKVMTYIINRVQAGFIKGRNVSEILRQVADIMEYNARKIKTRVS